MATPDMPVDCQTCNSSDIRKHCDSKNCSWFLCENCKSFGTLKRWADPKGSDKK